MEKNSCMENSVRVLVLISSMDAGGAETFIMKVFRTIDRNKIIFDFLVCDHKKGFYDDEIKNLGGKIVYGEFKSRHPIKSFTKIYLTVKREQYKVVFRCSEHPMAYLDLLAAKLGGAKILMIRSTNTSAGGGGLSNILASVFRPLLNSISTVKMAPSTEAGEWLFGKRMMAKGEVYLMNNGVEVDKFTFNQDIRDTMRQELSLNDKFVIGHVGRFNIQKNHSFLLDIFAAIAEKCPEAVLMLVGQGELEQEIKNKAQALMLDDRILFMGIRPDINRLMMAMDVFVFPSLYEGMPNTIIEAQATGLPCIISDTITREAAITDLVAYKSIAEKAEIWAQLALSAPNFRREPHLMEIIQTKGYDIKKTSEQITNCIVLGRNCHVKGKN
jgi:glycosyltransferase involved in cell wall biosynthesis